MLGIEENVPVPGPTPIEDMSDSELGSVLFGSPTPTSPPIEEEEEVGIVGSIYESTANIISAFGEGFSSGFGNISDIGFDPETEKAMQDAGLFVG